MIAARLSMQEAVDFLEPLFPDLTVIIQHTYHPGCCSKKWHYTVGVYRDDGSGYDLIYYSGMQNTLWDATFAVLEEAGLCLYCGWKMDGDTCHNPECACAEGEEAA